MNSAKTIRNQALRTCRETKKAGKGFRGKDIDEPLGEQREGFQAWTFAFWVMVGIVKNALLRTGATRRLRSLWSVGSVHKSYSFYTMPRLQAKRADRHRLPTEFISGTCRRQSVVGNPASGLHASKTHKSAPGCGCNISSIFSTHSISLAASTGTILTNCRQPSLPAL